MLSSRFRKRPPPLEETKVVVGGAEGGIKGEVSESLVVRVTQFMDDEGGAGEEDGKGGSGDGETDDSAATVEAASVGEKWEGRKQKDDDEAGEEVTSPRNLHFNCRLSSCFTPHFTFCHNRSARLRP